MENHYYTVQIRMNMVNEFESNYGVDEIEFRSGQYDTLTRLAIDILEHDERAMELPGGAYSSFSYFFDQLSKSNEFSDRYTLSLKKDEEDTVQILCFNQDPMVLGTFIFFEDEGDFRHIYLTTGSSAIDLLVEFEMKNIVHHVEGSSWLYSRAKGGAAYITADMVYPDTGFKVKRFEKEIEDSEDEMSN